MEEQSSLATIQALRAIAAFWVAIFHMRVPYAEIGGSQSVISFLNAGWVGVDAFFVLSGFIMWTTTHESTDGRKFIKKRLTRIYTSLWPALALFCLAKWCGSGGDIEIDGLSFWNSLTLLDPNPVAEHSFLFVTWTLTFELSFYLIFGAILLLGRRHALLCTLLFAMLIELGIFAKAQLSWPVPSLLADRAYYEFVLGAVSAHVFSVGVGRIPSMFLAILGITSWCVGTDFVG